jgi:hypothetical protein
MAIDYGMAMMALMDGAAPGRKQQNRWQKKKPLAVKMLAIIIYSGLSAQHLSLLHVLVFRKIFCLLRWNLSINNGSRAFLSNFKR